MQINKDQLWLWNLKQTSQSLKQGYQWLFSVENSLGSTLFQTSALIVNNSSVLNAQKTKVSSWTKLIFLRFYKKYVKTIFLNPPVHICISYLQLTTSASDSFHINAYILQIGTSLVHRNVSMRAHVMYERYTLPSVKIPSIQWRILAIMLIQCCSRSSEGHMVNTYGGNDDLFALHNTSFWIVLIFEN